MSKLNINKTLILVVILVMSVTVFVGCSSNDNSQSAGNSELTVGVNLPEISTQSADDVEIASVKATVVNQNNDNDKQTDKEEISDQSEIAFQFSNLVKEATYDIEVVAKNPEGNIVYQGTEEIPVTDDANVDVELKLAATKGLEVNIKNMLPEAETGTVSLLLPDQDNIEEEVDFDTNKADFTSVPANNYTMQVKLLDKDGDEIYSKTAVDDLEVKPGEIVDVDYDVETQEIEYNDTPDDGEETTEEYNLTLMADNGDIKLDPEQETYQAGTAVAVEAVADDGYVFAGWDGSLGGTDKTKVITVENDMTIRAKFQEIGSKKWSVAPKAGTRVSDVAIGKDGTIYGGDSTIYAISPDGETKWVFEPEEDLGSINGPVVAGETIYFTAELEGSDHPVESRLYAVDTNGNEKWSFSGYNMNEDPVIGPNGEIHLIYDVVENDSVAKEVVAKFDPQDGTKTDLYSLSDGRLAFLTIKEDGTIYVGGSNLYSLDSKGNLNWKLYDDDTSWISRPVIDEDGTIYVGGINNGEENLIAVSATGTKKWVYQTPEQSSSDASWNGIGLITIGNDGTLYATGGSIFYAINKDDGSEKWTFKSDVDWFTGTAIGDNGLIYVGSGSEDNDFGRTYALDSAGNVIWSFKAYGGMSSPLIADDGTIYIGSDSLYALEGGDVSLADTPWPMLGKNKQRTDK